MQVNLLSQKASHGNLMDSISLMKYLAVSFAENKMGRGRVGDIRKWRNIKIATVSFGRKTQLKNCRIIFCQCQKPSSAGNHTVMEATCVGMKVNRQLQSFLLVGQSWMITSVCQEALIALPPSLHSSFKQPQLQSPLFYLFYGNKTNKFGLIELTRANLFLQLRADFHTGDQKSEEDWGLFPLTQEQVFPDSTGIKHPLSELPYQGQTRDQKDNELMWVFCHMNHVLFFSNYLRMNPS